VKLQWNHPTNWSAEDTTGTYYIEFTEPQGSALYKRGRLVATFRYMGNAKKAAEHPHRIPELKREEDPTRPEDECPRCGSHCDRDEADVGVGIIYGPYGCGCGWSEDDKYDAVFGDGGWQADGSYRDPYGGHWPKGNPVTRLMRAAEEREVSAQIGK
jgi:hypothetical protein